MVRQLVGIEKYRTQPEPKRLTQRQRLVERADEVSIFRVLEDYFDISVPEDADSFKTYCPFAFEHPDGGVDKGWRTYPATNSSYCFVMHGVMGPTRLVSIKHDLRAHRAAEEILRRYDLLDPGPWRERFEESRQRLGKPVEVGSPQQAVEALEMALSSLPAYPTRQFDADVQDAMEKALNTLEKVFDRPDPRQYLRQWYETAKKHMTRVIEEGTPS